MSTRHSLVSELERLASALADNQENRTPEVLLPSVAERIAKHVGVKTEELAILGLSTRWKHLYFLVPVALKHVGHIPLSSNSALAARTARESRPEINNAFDSVKHATGLEGVKTGAET